MNGTSAPEPAQPPTGEQQVLDYLRAHPGLLADHPELAATLVMGHPEKGVISLAEHQQRRLRQENAALRAQLADLIANAQENAATQQRLATLNRELLRQSDLAELLAQLRATLVRDFDTDALALDLVQSPALPAGLPPWAHTTSDAAGLTAAYGESTRLPRCVRRLDGALSERLFPTRPEADGATGTPFASWALLPLECASGGDAGYEDDETDRPPLGVLVLASRSEARFSPALGTDLLAQLGALVAAHLARFLPATGPR